MGLQLSGSVQLEGNLLVTGSVNSVFENVLVTGTLVAQEIETQLVSSSIIYSSGSNKFGDLITDKQQFTGSLQVSGSSHSILGNVGVAVAPVEYSFSDTNNIQVRRAILAGTDNSMRLSINTNYSGNDFRRISTGRASMYQQSDGNHYFFTSPTGNAGISSNFTSSLTLDATGAATFANSVTAGSGLINGTTDAFFDLNRSASGNASRVRFQTTGSDEFEIGLKGGVPGFHITTGDATELLTVSGSNVGIGILPKTWAGTNTKSLQVYLGSMAASLTFGTAFTFNSYYDGSWRYNVSGNAGKYEIGGNEHMWYSAPVGAAAGDVATFTEGMRLDASSRLGINYNNSAIHTYGSSAYSAQLTVKAASASAITLLNSTTGGDAQVAINFVNEFTSGQYNYIARIIAEPEGSWTSTASTRDSRLSFHTTLNGVTSEAMRIASTANTQIYGSLTVDKGITVSSNAFGSFFGKFGAASTPVLELRDFDGDQTGTTLILRSSRSEIFYHMQAFNNSSTECFRIEANGNVKNTNSSYGSLSDVKIKENISDATPKLEDLLKVRIRNYNIIGQDIKQIGVIAQELEEVFPSMVDENADRDQDGNLVGTYTKGVKYSVFIPMLIKAIQELQSQIEELKSRIETLENI